MRNFWKENKGAFRIWKIYPKSFKEKYWLMILFLARLQAWVLGFIKVKLLKKKSQALWKRIESTK